MVISKQPLRFILTAVIACLPLFSFANIVSDSTKVTTEAVHVVSDTATVAIATEKPETASKEDIAAEERAEYIQHHLRDSHDFNFFSYGKESGHETHVGFPLPVILWDNGFQFFMSSKFHHGEEVAESNGNYYMIGHHDGMVYKTDAAGSESKIKPLDLSITKNIFWQLAVFLQLARSV